MPLVRSIRFLRTAPRRGPLQAALRCLSVAKRSPANGQLCCRHRMADLERVHARLLEWYTSNARPLPWRRTRDPYAILVSEVMLQQTQAVRVVPYYGRFLERFTTAAALAAAEPAEVLQLWSGLGYNRRALALQRAAAEGAAPRSPPPRLPCAHRGHRPLPSRPGGRGAAGRRSAAAARRPGGGRPGARRAGRPARGWIGGPARG